MFRFNLNSRQDKGLRRTGNGYLEQAVHAVSSRRQAVNDRWCSALLYKAVQYSHVD